MDNDLTDEQKEAENERLDALEAQQEKNRQRATRKKAVKRAPRKKSSIRGDLIACVTLKKIHRPGTAFDMTEIGEQVSLPRESAKKLQDVGAVKVVL